MVAQQPLAARVSRREVALSRQLWLAQATMFGILAASCAVLALGPFTFDSAPLLGLAAGLAAVTAILLLTPPQPIDALGNHLAVASTYLGASAAMVAFSPQTLPGAAAIMFVGPLAAVRLVDRREISGHLTLATLFVIGPALYAHSTPEGFIGMGTLVIGMWVLGGCCVFVMETAEAQGEELEKLVRRDPLTGVGNRRMLTEQLARQLRRHQRSRKPLSLLSIDLDGLGRLNDTLGHSAGDEILVRVAQALVGAVPSTSIVTRPGGDKFSILLVDASPDQARHATAAVREGLAACGTTAGIGAASFPRDAVHDKVLMHLADQRLVEDKAANRVAGPASTSALRVLPEDRRSA